jgi:hypothetical protein
MHTAKLILHIGGNVQSSLTKGLQLKWSSLGSEGTGQGVGELGALNQVVWVLKVPNFP